MASIKKRTDGVYRARYRDAAGKEHARHFERKVDAQRWIDTVTAAVVTGQYVDPKAAKTTFKAYAESWSAAQPWRPQTRARVESHLRVHLYPAFGDRPLGSVRPTEVQALVTRLGTTMAPGSVRVVYATLRSVFKAAVEDRLLTASPCVRVGLPTVARKTLVVPSAATVRALSVELAKVDKRSQRPSWRPLPFIAAGLGLRPAEVFGLRVEDVNFLARTVTVERQVDPSRKLVPLKTAASYRTVPLPQVVADELAAYLAGLGRREGLVFTDDAGRPVLLNTAQRAWRTSATAAGQSGLRLHDLRHAYASALIHAGESVKTVQHRMGHASAMVTLDIYGHLWPDSEEATRAAVDAWLAGPADFVRTDDAKPQVSA